MNLNLLAAEAHRTALKRLPELENVTPTIFKLKTYIKIIEENGEFVKAEPTEDFSKDSEQSEIADIIITLLTYSASRNYDVEKLITDKMEYNRSRE